MASLYQLRPEIETSLKMIELQISDFIDDASTAPALADAIEAMQQIRSVLTLIHLEGANELSSAIMDALEFFVASSDNTKEKLIYAVSEGVMILGRYIEFVLLREKLEPKLLLGAINSIRLNLQKSLLGESHFQSITPKLQENQARYLPVSKLGSAAGLLQSMYRLGLVEALRTTGATSLQSKPHVQLLQQVCQQVYERIGSAYWQAAVIATEDLHKILPLSSSRKHTLIGIEAQLATNQDELGAEGFADVVSMAISRSTEKAKALKYVYGLKSSTDEELHDMYHFMNGPNRDVIDTVNDLIQEEISQTKDKIDDLARSERFEAQQYRDIAIDMRDLSLRLYMLGLKTAAQNVMLQAKTIATWVKKGNQAQYDALLKGLLYAENASTLMAKSHTPGAISLPLNNTDISLHQLDTAFEALIKEARSTLANAQGGMLAYTGSKEQDILHLHNLPTMLHAVGGAMLFVGAENGNKLLGRAAKYVTSALNHYDVVPDVVLGRLADIISAADYYLECIESGRPSGEQPLVLGAHSLKHLLAAA